MELLYTLYNYIVSDRTHFLVFIFIAISLFILLILYLETYLENRMLSDIRFQKTCKFLRKANEKYLKNNPDIRKIVHELEMRQLGLEFVEKTDGGVMFKRRDGSFLHIRTFPKSAFGIKRQQSETTIKGGF